MLGARQGGADRGRASAVGEQRLGLCKAAAPENLKKHPVSLHSPHACLSTSSMALGTPARAATPKPTLQRSRDCCLTQLPPPAPRLPQPWLYENQVSVYGQSTPLLVMGTMRGRQPWWPQACLDSKDPGNSSAFLTRSHCSDLFLGSDPTRRKEARGPRLPYANPASDPGIKTESTYPECVDVSGRMLGFPKWLFHR